MSTRVPFRSEPNSNRIFIDLTDSDDKEVPVSDFCDLSLSRTPIHFPLPHPIDILFDYAKRFLSPYLTWLLVCLCLPAPYWLFCISSEDFYYTHNPPSPLNTSLLHSLISDLGFNNPICDYFGTQITSKGPNHCSIQEKLGPIRPIIRCVQR